MKNLRLTKYSVLFLISLGLMQACSLQIFENNPKNSFRQVASRGECSLIKDQHEDLYQIQRAGKPVDPIWYDLDYAHKKLNELSTTEDCQ